jgi:hypothetical protein
MEHGASFSNGQSTSYGLGNPYGSKTCPADIRPVTHWDFTEGRSYW